MKRGFRVRMGCSDTNTSRDICMASKTEDAQKHHILIFRSSSLFLAMYFLIFAIIIYI